MNAEIEVTPERIPAVRAPFRLQWEPVQNAWVLLYPEGMVRLNPSAGEILQRCDGQRPAADIAAELGAAFDAPADDVLQFLEVATRQGWLQWT